MGISRARIEGLKDMADDDRMDAPSWTLDRTVGTFGCGLIFAGIGGLLNYTELNISASIAYLVAAIIGGVLAAFGYGRELVESGKRVSYRTKLCGKIQKILDEVEQIKATKAAQSEFQ